MESASMLLRAALGRRPQGLRERLREFEPALKFTAGLGVFVAALAVYTYLRFDTLDTRASYHHWHFLQPEICGGNCQAGGLFGKGFFDWAYITRHTPIILEKLPYLQSEKPFIVPSWAGAAFWTTTPAFLYALFAGVKNRFVMIAGVVSIAISLPLFVILPSIAEGSAPAVRPVFDWAQFDVPHHFKVLPFLLLMAYGVYIGLTRNKLILACWAAIIPMAVVHFTHGNTGYPQLGYRYLLDYAPFVFLLTWQGMGNKLRWHHVLFISVSIALTVIGVLWLNKFDRDLTGGFHWASW